MVGIVFPYEVLRILGFPLLSPQPVCGSGYADLADRHRKFSEELDWGRAPVVGMADAGICDERSHRAVVFIVAALDVQRLPWIRLFTLREAHTVFVRIADRVHVGDADIVAADIHHDEAYCPSDRGVHCRWRTRPQTGHTRVHT